MQHDTARVGGRGRQMIQTVALFGLVIMGVSARSTTLESLTASPSQTEALTRGHPTGSVESSMATSNHTESPLNHAGQLQNDTSRATNYVLNYTDNSETVIPKLKMLMSSGNYSDVFRKPADFDPDVTTDDGDTADTIVPQDGTRPDTESTIHQSQSQGHFLYVPNPEKHTENNCFIVKIKESVEKETFEKLSAVFGVLDAKIHKKYQHGFIGYSLCFPGNILPLSIMREIPWIEFIERDNIVSASQIQEDAPWGLARLSSPDMHSQSFGFDATGEGVSVYVIDSGLVRTKELADRGVLGYTAFPDSPPDCSGHGTEVSSVIAGKNVGVAKRAQVIVAQVLNCQGDGRNSDLIDAVSWVIQTHKKPAVINMSLGGERSPSVEKAVKAAVAAGITVVVAAGNSNIDACTQSPAAAVEAITVAASSSKNTRAKFSNYGPCVDIFAPGVDILTAVPPEKSRNGWSFVSGTSFSAPFVTGVIALLLEQHPEWTPVQIASEIERLAARAVISPATIKGSPNLLLQAPSAKAKQPILVSLDSAALPILGYHTSSIVTLELALVVCALILALLALVSTGVALFRRHRRRRMAAEPGALEGDLKASILSAQRPSVFL